MNKVTKKQHKQEGQAKKQGQSTGQFMQVMAAAEAEKLLKILPGSSPGVSALLQK